MVNGNNLNNKKYFQILQEADSGTAKLVAPPRFYGIRMG